MLDDHHATGGEQTRRQRERVRKAGIVVGRIEIDNLKALPGGPEPPEGGARIPCDDLGGAGPPAELEVLGDEAEGDRVALQEDGAPRAAAQRLAADGARAGVRVQETRTLDARSQDVEQRFAHPVGRRPGPKSPRRLQPAPPGFSARESQDRSNARQRGARIIHRADHGTFP